MRISLVLFLWLDLSLGSIEEIEEALSNGASYIRDKLLSRSGAQLQSLSAFHDFMMYHNKSYSSKEEYKMRYNVFRSNMKIVE